MNTQLETDVKRIMTYKSHTAMNLAAELSGNGRIAAPTTRQDIENVYAWLADHDYVWSSKDQRWRKRKPGTRRPAKRPIVKENSFVLVRIMAKREILDRDRENFALAFEAIGYEIVSYSEPIENRENGFHRVYLKAKGG